MPYISFSTNVKIKDKDEFEKELVSCVTAIPNKTTTVTMVEIHDEANMYFRDNSEPCAMVKTQVNKGTDMSTTKEYADKVIDVVSSMLGVEEDRIYVTVSEEEKWHLRRK